MTRDEARMLIDRYLTGNCTDSERKLVENFYQRESDAQSRPIDVPDPDALKAEMWDSVSSGASRRKVRKLHYIGWAAAFAVSISLIIYLTMPQKAGTENKYTTFDEIAKPGGNRAHLTLSDGTAFNLDTLVAGTLWETKDLKISKTADGELVYETKHTDGATSDANMRNIIHTPKGGQIQLRLPDGSRVWLNASSTLFYPVAFNGTHRTVQLKGEAYFEVAADRGRPFIVNSAGQQIRVLGTQFNVSAYADESGIATTLVNGSVQVAAQMGGQSILLKPGHQSRFANGRFDVRQVEAADYTAWKNGLIVLHEADFPAVIRQISRWYNVEFDLPEMVATERVYGELKRNVPLSEVLQALEVNYGVKFKRDGRRIMVYQ
jgi:transmembrane sensor